MPTQEQMLRAIHKANPKTLSQRYTPQQVQAAFGKLGSGSAGTSGASLANAQTVQQGQNTLATNASNIANAQLTTAGTDPFSFQSNEAARQAAEDAAYGRLTRGVDQQEGRDMEQAKQTLANQGIQYDPNPGSRYQNELNDLTRRYDTIRGNAHQDAVAAGGQELERQFNIQSGAFNTKLGGIDATSRLGLPGAVSFEQLSQADKQRLTDEALKRLALKRQSGGGGGNDNGFSLTDPGGGSAPGGL